jgi:hypothetical protein
MTWPVPIGPHGTQASLQVGLHLVDRALLRPVRILAEFGSRPALAQQVPCLVELTLERFQPLPVRAGQAAPGVAVAQSLLLGDQFVDVLENRLVVH